MGRIADLQDLLQKQSRVLEVVEAEAQELADRFGRPRRSLICAETQVRPLPNITPRAGGRR